MRQRTVTDDPELACTSRSPRIFTDGTVKRHALKVSADLIANRCWFHVTNDRTGAQGLTIMRIQNCSPTTFREYVLLILGCVDTWHSYLPASAADTYLAGYTNQNEFSYILFGNGPRAKLLRALNIYRDRQIHKSQVPRKLGEKIAFFCLLQAGDRKFLSSYSPNLGFVDLPIPVHHKQIYLLLWHP